MTGALNRSVRALGLMCVLLLSPAWARDPLTKTPRLGTFKMTHWSLNGVPAEPMVPSLTLKPGGEYSFGGAKGRWTLDAAGVALQGPYAHWGSATVRANGDELVFDYTRGAAHFEVVMRRDAETAEQATR